MSYSVIEVATGDPIPAGLEVVRTLEEHEETRTLLVERVSLVGVPQPHDAGP